MHQEETSEPEINDCTAFDARTRLYPADGSIRISRTTRRREQENRNLYISND